MGGLRISVLVFFVIFIAVRGLAVVFSRDKEEIARRVLTFTRDNRTGQHAQSENDQIKKEERRLLGLFRSLTPKRILDKAELELQQTDILLRPEELVSLQVGAVILPALFGMVVLQNTGMAVLLCITGVIAPAVYLRIAKTRRQKKFNDQLGEALSIMANSLRAGFSFLQSLDSLQKEMGPPLSTEFGRALREMRLGTPTEEALGNMTKRVKSDDLELVVTAVNIQRQVGGNLSEILDNISFTIKERLRIKGEVKTLTAQGRISGLIVGLLPIGLAAVIFITNPSYIGVLFAHPLGLAMLAGAGISELIGAAMIKKIVNIEF